MMSLPTARLIHGDCLEHLEDTPSGSIDMVLCDLPYGTTKNKWDTVIPLDCLWKQYNRVVKDNGAIVLTSQGIFTAKLILSQENLFKYKLVWVKNTLTNFLNAKKQPLRKHEDVCIFYRKQPTYIPQMGAGKPYKVHNGGTTESYGPFKSMIAQSYGERYPTDVLNFDVDGSKGGRFHPTQKPIELGRYLVRTFTQQGDTVLDNCFGSGSFLVAVAMEGRNSVGMETDEGYVSLAKDRLKGLCTIT